MVFPDQIIWFKHNFRGKIKFWILRKLIYKKFVVLQIWDTAGDHKLRDLVSLYYRNSHAALLVFDITQTETKENLQDWLSELENRCDLENVIIKVAANKYDLLQSKRQDNSLANIVVGSINYIRNRTLTFMMIQL